jgi:hypothetical protein
LLLLREKVKLTLLKQPNPIHMTLKKTLLYITLIFTSNVLYGQNKKEQLLFMQKEIDSINSLLLKEKERNSVLEIVHTNLTNDFIVLKNLKTEKEIKLSELETELSALKKVNIELENERIQLTNCNKLLNLYNLTNIHDLNEIQFCAKSSTLISDFYIYYYEVWVLSELKKNLSSQNKIEDGVLLEILRNRRGFYASPDPRNAVISEKINTLDSIFLAENYSTLTTKLTDEFIEKLTDFYLYNIGLSDEYLMKIYGDYVWTFYNLSGAGTEPNTTQLYKIHGNDQMYVPVYENLLEPAEKYLTKHFGKGCFISHDFHIEQQNDGFLISCTVYKFDDPLCCGSGKATIFTHDFNSFNLSTLKWGVKTNSGEVKVWHHY